MAIATDSCSLLATSVMSDTPSDEFHVEEIRRQARQRDPLRSFAAKVEGLPPLARIALTTRVARRAQRLVSLQPEAKHVLEAAIRAGEKVASGELIDAAEEQAARDEVILQAIHAEDRDGNKAAAMALTVARAIAGCLNGPEVAYGENFFLAYFHLQMVVRIAASGRGLESGEVEQAVRSELQQVEDDREKLLGHLEACGEGWIDPHLERVVGRNDRGWERMLTAAAIPRGRGENREKWRRIHEAVKQAGGCFCPPTIFDQMV